MEQYTITIDGQPVTAWEGQTIMEAAHDAGIYVPHLCYLKGLVPFGSCRVCTVKADGRFVSACTQPVTAKMLVENDSEELLDLRRSLIEMLFVEGNHYCMFCEKSGNCELQAMGYRFGITGPRHDYQFPERRVDASHPDILLDMNRCILCARCVRASRDLDGKGCFEFVGKGKERRIAVNSESRLKDTVVDVTDEAMDVCPVGAILKKRVGFKVPIGRRLYDEEPIGTDVELRRRPVATAPLNGGGSR
jgi:[NiFe] hydrogenase diaphorase moiety small subunit